MKASISPMSVRASLTVFPTPSPTNQSDYHPPAEPDLNAALDRDHYIPPSAAGIAPEKASAILSQFERKRRAAAIAVPTDDTKVRQQLRSLGEPITLFGEGPGDRRDRLRELLTSQDDDEDGDLVMGDAASQDDADAAGGDENEEFYTEGTAELLAARQTIARYSLPRARDRLANQKLEATIPLRTHIKHRNAIKSKLGEFELYGTQIAGERPVSNVRFSPSGSMVAAGNWSGGVKLLSIPSLDEIRTLRGHTDRIGGLAWYPGATIPDSTVSSQAVNLASSGGEGQIHLWNLESDLPISTLEGHSGRVCRIDFHPAGQYLASASYDTTWRLWDIPTSSELLLQEGHSREVYTVAFSPNEGSLLASAGLDAVGRIWDLRTGRTVMILDKHIKDIYALDWSHDGHRVLSGSGDGFARCWDLRAVREAGAIGANQGGVTDLRWYKGPDAYLPPVKNGAGTGAGAEGVGAGTGTGAGAGTGVGASAGAGVGPGSSSNSPYIPKTSGTFFISGGFDKNILIFSGDDWARVKTLSGHSGNVLGVDVSPDARWIASCGHDRTVKVWGREEREGEGEGEQGAL